MYKFLFLLLMNKMMITSESIKTTNAKNDVINLTTYLSLKTIDIH